jgi:A/G-specific adenine glycosylase
MDLGSEIKKVRKGINARSKHHVKQSPYHGSNRQVRAMVLKLLAEHRSITKHALARRLRVDGERVERAVSDLVREGLVRLTQRRSLALP